jgi:hypothetical protein
MGDGDTDLVLAYCTIPTTTDSGELVPMIVLTKNEEQTNRTDISTAT